MVKKLSWFSKGIFLLNILLGICFLLSIMAPYTRPSSFWLPSLFGLAFPMIYMGNFVFLFYWIIRKKQQFVLSLTLAIAGFHLASASFQFNSSRETKNGIKVVSYNVRNFDLYNWSDNETTRDEILAFLNSSNGDLICLQEFFYTTDPEHQFTTLDTLQKMFSGHEFHVEATTTVKETEHWGIATLSRYPIIRRGRIDFSGSANNLCIYSDLIIGKDTVRVYNIHLASVHFGAEDYSFIDHLGEEVNEQELSKSIGVIDKLRTAYRKRGIQADAVAASIKSCRYPVIVCGDFNDTPVSYSYRSIGQGLNDAFINRGIGMGSTYNGNLPGLRIDYILHSSALATLSYRTVEEDHSDHFPIIAHLKVKKKNQSK